MMTDGNIPYSTIPTFTAPYLRMGVESQIKRYKEEEKGQKAPKILPFDLQSSDEMITQIYEKVMEYRKVLIESKIKTFSKDDKNKAHIDNLLSKLDEINDILLFDIPNELSNIEI